MATLYVVSTPIGNLEDITLRALRVLGEVSAVFAEDTRRTRILLDRHEIATPTRSLHAHNEAARIDELIAALDDGADLAIVSDAGTPLISDPGERVVRRARAAGHAVVPIPGASALLAAVVASGLPTGRIQFLGFLPRKAGERDRLLEGFVERPETLVCFESPKRLAATLRALREQLGDRDACVARELTKQHEELVDGTLSELEQRFADGARGECTIVVSGGEAAAWDDARLRDAIRAALARGERPKALAASLHRQSGRPKREIYALAIAEEGEA